MDIRSTLKFKCQSDYYLSTISIQTIFLKSEEKKTKFPYGPMLKPMSCSGTHLGYLNDI